MDEARALHEITRRAVDAHELTDFAAETIGRARELLGLEACCLWLPSRDGQRLVQAACSGSEMARGPLRLDQPCAETQAYHTQTATFTDNPDLTGSKSCEYSSYAIFPLRSAEGALGVVVFARGAGQPFSADDEQRLSEVADHVALGISLVQLRQEHARREALQVAFDGMTKSLLLTTTTPEDVLRNASTYLRDYLGAQGSIAAVPEGQWWRILAAHGYPASIIGRRYHQTVMFGMSAAARNRTPLLAEEASRVSSIVSGNGKVSSAMLVPLVTPAGVAAVIACGFQERHEFSEWDLDVALQVSETISLGFQNAMLRSAEQQALHLADRLRSMQAKLFSATDDENSMDDSLAKAAELVGAVACSFVVQEPDGWRFEHTADERGMFGFDEVRSDVHELLDIWTERAGMRAYTSPTPGLALDDVWIAVAPVPNASPRSAIVCIRRDGRFSLPQVNFLQNLARSVSLAELDRRVRADREWLAASRQQWLAGVSHDLRTPLASIRGYAELLAQPVVVPPEEVQRQARIMAEQTWRIQALVEDMLMTFRIKEGALPVSLEPADLFEVARLVADETRADFRITDPERLRVEGRPGIHFSRVDPHLLERAVRNLVSNAIVHNPPGTCVTIRLVQTRDAEQLAVIDNGSGMDAEQLTRLWNRYERGDGSPNANGIGLGMSVSRQLVEAMGGTIGIVSGVSSGTTVTISFPPVSSAVAV